MANAVTSDLDFGDQRVYDITWDTDLTLNKYFSLDAQVTPYNFDFSRYEFIQVIPYQSTGTGATATYTFSLACAGLIGTYSPVAIKTDAGYSGSASIATGTPAAAIRTAGYLQSPARKLHLVITAAGTAITEVRFLLVGYKSRVVT